MLVRKQENEFIRGCTGPNPSILKLKKKKKKDWNKLFFYEGRGEKKAGHGAHCIGANVGCYVGARKLFLFFCSSSTLCSVFLNYKIPYSSYPQEHYLIKSLQQQTHTFLQYNSNRHFVIQNTPEIMLPVPLHSGVIFCVITKKNCWKQIEKCNNWFAVHDLHEG